VVFGDDDIPYIVESSGIELVDGDIADIFEYMDADEPAELEELEGEEGELEELETEEEPGSGVAASAQPKPRMSEATLSEIASAIEFAPMEPVADETPLPDFDIVSPFDSILHDFFSETAGSEQPDGAGEAAETDGIEAIVPEKVETEVEGTIGELESIDSSSQSLPALYRPFFSAGGRLDTLEAMEDDGNGHAGSAELLAVDDDSGEPIEFRDGLAFVSAGASGRNSREEDFDPELKNLVDSVVRR